MGMTSAPFHMYAGAHLRGKVGLGSDRYRLMEIMKVFHTAPDLPAQKAFAQIIDDCDLIWFI